MKNLNWACLALIIVFANSAFGQARDFDPEDLPDSPANFKLKDLRPGSSLKLDARVFGRASIPVPPGKETQSRLVVGWDAQLVESLSTYRDESTGLNMTLSQAVEDLYNTVRSVTSIEQTPKDPLEAAKSLSDKMVKCQNEYNPPTQVAYPSFDSYFKSYVDCKKEAKKLKTLLAAVDKKYLSQIDDKKVKKDISRLKSFLDENLNNEYYPNKAFCAIYFKKDLVKQTKTPTYLEFAGKSTRSLQISRIKSIGDKQYSFTVQNDPAIDHIECQNVETVRDVYNLLGTPSKFAKVDTKPYMNMVAVPNLRSNQNQEKTPKSAVDEAVRNPSTNEGDSKSVLAK